MSQNHVYARNMKFAKIHDISIIFHNFQFRCIHPEWRGLRYTVTTDTLNSAEEKLEIFVLRNNLNSRIFDKSWKKKLLRIFKESALNFLRKEDFISAAKYKERYE